MIKAEEQLNRLVTLYQSIKNGIKRRKLRLDVTCYDTFETAKLRESAYLLPEEGESEPDYSIPKELLVTCPARCILDPSLPEIK